MINVGDQITLYSKQYKIVGTIRRSFIIEDASGKQFMISPKQVEKATGQKAAPVQRKPQAELDEEALAARVRCRQIFDKSARMPETEAEIMEYIEGLRCDLSPEILCCDGEASPAQVKRKRQEIASVWRALERRLGRKIAEY